MSDQLQGKKVAVIATDGFENSELFKPLEAVKEVGATVEVLSIDTGEIEGAKDEEPKTIQVDKLVKDANVDDYDGLILPGGVANPDALRMDNDVIRFIQDYFKQGKPAGVICHAPWLLIEADVAKGRKVTSWPSVRTDLRNAGAEVVDEEVVVDQGLVTSRKPDDLPAFCAKIVEEFAEGTHDVHPAGATSEAA
jgi:protease I